MVLTDWTMRNLILELDNNARQSATSIGKKLGISKVAVHNRIRKLFEIGVIKGYSTIMNVEKLGCSYYNIFLKTNNMTTVQEQKFVEYVRAAPNITWAVRSIGDYTHLITIMAQTANELDQHLEELFENIECLQSYEIFIVTKEYKTSYKYLNPEQTPKIDNSKHTQTTTNLTKQELKILQILDEQPLTQITEIASKLKMNRHQVKHIIQQLQDTGVIQSFRTQINPNKLNLQLYLALLKLNPTTTQENQEFIKYLLNHQNITYVIKGIGKYQLMIDIHAQNIEQLNQIIQEIKQKHNNQIKNQTITQIPEVYKLRYCIGMS